MRGGVALRAAPRRPARPARRCACAAGSRARGAPIPRRGKLVAIQYREAATGRWRPVLVTRSDHGGRFRARYRFRYVSGRREIRLRATALAEERWPYAPGASRPLTVSGSTIGRVAAMSQATLHTSAGAIVLELHDDDAPKTVENFRKLAADGSTTGSSSTG